MIDGRVEDGETSLEAAIKEAHEELIFNPEPFKFIVDFDEIATSNPNLKIHFYIFEYQGDLQEELTISDEIEPFLWHETSHDFSYIKK